MFTSRIAVRSFASGKALAALVLLAAAFVSREANASQTHRFSMSEVGQAQYNYDIHNVAQGMLLFTGGRVTGFSHSSSVQLATDNTGVGPFTGTFQAVRSTGGHNNRTGEVLFGSATGFAIDNGQGIAYFATVTITGGTERLAGATGIIHVTIYQRGYIDPAILGNRIPVDDFQCDGEYNLP